MASHTDYRDDPQSQLVDESTYFVWFSSLTLIDWPDRRLTQREYSQLRTIEDIDRFNDGE